MSIHYQHLSENKASSNFSNLEKQQGSAIVMSLFVIIILTLLGSVLMRMISTSSEAMSQEVLGTRAYMAANSAMEGELQRLFPLNTISSGYCDTEFTNRERLLETALGDDIPGLYDCVAKVSCKNYHNDLITGTKYYRLTSTGECGSGVMDANSKVIVKSSRTIQVEARSL